MTYIVVGSLYSFVEREETPHMDNVGTTRMLGQQTVLFAVQCHHSFSLLPTLHARARVVMCAHVRIHHALRDSWMLYIIGEFKIWR